MAALAQENAREEKEEREGIRFPYNGGGKERYKGIKREAKIWKIIEEL